MPLRFNPILPGPTQLPVEAFSNALQSLDKRYQQGEETMLGTEDYLGMQKVAPYETDKRDALLGELDHNFQNLIDTNKGGLYSPQFMRKARVAARDAASDPRLQALLQTSKAYQDKLDFEGKANASGERVLFANDPVTQVDPTTGQWIGGTYGGQAMRDWVGETRDIIGRIIPKESQNEFFTALDATPIGGGLVPALTSMSKEVVNDTMVQNQVDAIISAWKDSPTGRQVMRQAGIEHPEWTDDQLNSYADKFVTNIAKLQKVDNIKYNNQLINPKWVGSGDGEHTDAQTGGSDLLGETIIPNSVSESLGYTPTKADESLVPEITKVKPAENFFDNIMKRLGIPAWDLSPEAVLGISTLSPLLGTLALSRAALFTSEGAKPVYTTERVPAVESIGGNNFMKLMEDAKVNEYKAEYPTSGGVGPVISHAPPTYRKVPIQNEEDKTRRTAFVDKYVQDTKDMYAALGKVFDPSVASVDDVRNQWKDYSDKVKKQANLQPYFRPITKLDANGQPTGVQIAADSRGNQTDLTKENKEDEIRTRFSNATVYELDNGELKLQDAGDKKRLRKNDKGLPDLRLQGRVDPNSAIAATTDNEAVLSGDIVDIAGKKYLITDSTPDYTNNIRGGIYVATSAAPGLRITRVINGDKVEMQTTGTLVGSGFKEPKINVYSINGHKLPQEAWSNLTKDELASLLAEYYRRKNTKEYGSNP